MTKIILRRLFPLRISRSCPLCRCYPRPRFEPSVLGTLSYNQSKLCPPAPGSGQTVKILSRLTISPLDFQFLSTLSRLPEAEVQTLCPRNGGLLAWLEAPPCIMSSRKRRRHGTVRAFPAAAAPYDCQEGLPFSDTGAPSSTVRQTLHKLLLTSPSLPNPPNI